MLAKQAYLKEIDISPDDSIRVNRFVRDNEQEWIIDSHFHKKCEIVLYGSIQGEVSLNGETRKIRKGKILYLPPYAVHGFRLSEGRHIYSVMHIYHDTKGSEVTLEDLPASPSLITLNSEEYQLFERLFSVLQSSSTSVGIRNASIGFIIKLLKDDQQETVLSKDHTHSLRFQPLFIHLNKHAVYVISAEEAASICHMSRSSFLRNFKENYHIRFHEFLQARQIEEASYLLRQTERRCIDIAYDLGFTDASHFSKVFRQKMGMTPLAYRREGIQKGR